MINMLHTWFSKLFMRGNIKHYDFQGIPIDIAEDIKPKLIEKGYELVSVSQDKSAGTILWFKSNIDGWTTEDRDKYIRHIRTRKPQVDANSYQTTF